MPVGITLAAIDPGEAATVVERLRLMRGLRPQEDADILARLSKARAAFPQSAIIPALMAQTHYLAGEHEKAVADADAALAIAPEEPRALLYKGAAKLALTAKDPKAEPAAWKSARALIARSNRLNPDNPYPLYFYFRSFADQGQEPPELAKLGLAMAFEIVPQDDDVRFLYVQSLIKDKDLELALTLIKPLVYSPHTEKFADYGRKMIANLETAIASGKPFVLPKSQSVFEESVTASLAH